jgi:hypothetical protein
MNTADPDTGVDLYLGSGGAPEGVLACAALKCVGGQFQGRLIFRNDDERQRAERIGVKDLNRKYDLHELVSADALFVATGVTTGRCWTGSSGRGTRSRLTPLSWRRRRARSGKSGCGGRWRCDVLRGDGEVEESGLFLGVARSLSGRAWRRRPADAGLTRQHQQRHGLERGARPRARLARRGGG